MNRRDFMGIVGTVGACSLGSTPAQAEDVPVDEFNAILIDTTRCAGCRNCEIACAEANELPEPDLDDETIYTTPRDTSDSQFIAQGFRRLNYATRN